MKKILSIFALLMTMVIGAKADTTIFEYTVGEGDDSSSATATTGTVKLGANKVEKQSWSSTGYAFKSDGDIGSSKYIKATTTQALQVGDVISVTIGATSNPGGSDYGVVLSADNNSSAVVATLYLEKGVKSTAATYSYTVQTDDKFVGGKDVYVVRAAGKSTYIVNITIVSPSSATEAPTITTDLPAMAEVTVGVATEFSIEATGATSYQWYVGDEIAEGATSASFTYTASIDGGVDIYCNAINSAGTTKSTVCSVLATMPTSAPIITTDIETNYNVVKGKTLELSIVAEGAASYQWYLDNEPVEGATSASYTFTAGSTIGESRYIFCGATNAAGTTFSTVANVTTVGRADCELINIQFSNGAWGAINSGSYGDKTIAVPYTAETTAPTVETSSIVVSEGATYVLDGNTLTVIAEDGTTNKVFTITTVEITPLDVTADVEESFTAVPSWVFNLYGYDDNKGLKFAKAVNDGTGMRIALGNTRQYYFIGAAKSLTLKQKGTTRRVNVYVNGTKVLSDTDNDALGAIELDQTASNLVIIEAAAGTNGDGGFSAYSIEAAVAATETIELDESGVATYVTKNALDFSTINGAFKAYIPTGITDKPSVSTEEVTVVPAGTALLLKGAQGSYDVQIAESAEAPAVNLFKISDGNVRGADNIYAYSKGDKLFKKVDVTINVPAGKCYLVIDDLGPGSLDVDFEDEATAINNVNANENAKSAAPVKVIKNGKLYIGNYNVAGARIK